MTGINPLCQNANNATCFAICEGRCTVLDSTNFKDDVCPFCKTKERIAIENDKGAERRESMKR